MHRFVFLLLILAFLLSCGSNKADSPTQNSPEAELVDLPVLQSANGVLDLLMVAQATPSQLAGLQPNAWTYQVCQRTTAVNNACPSGASAPYGGVRLQLVAGDHLKIRLVNNLPPAPGDAEHMLENIAMLAPNPTNLHTHGLIVEPRQAGNGDPTYGDYVYVLGYPAGKLPPVAARHPGLDYTDQPIDFDVYIPPNHPSGLFWFHPHIHGLSLNQISAGMAGVITIGSVADYLRDANGNPVVNDSVKARQLLLKDTQIEKDSSMLTQQDPDFCTPDPAAGEAAREGFCSGQAHRDETGHPVDRTGGRWVHSINGQIFPAIHVNGGEVWRITSASGSRSYDLKLLDDTTGQALRFQVLSLDGVSLDIPVGTPAAQVQAAVEGRLATVACAGTTVGSQPVCGTSLHVMPSSRAEIYIAPQGTAKTATLMTPSYQSGADGDNWPSMKLAHVYFSGGTKTTSQVLSVHGASRSMLKRGGVLGSEPLVTVPGVSEAIPINQAIDLGKFPVGMSRTMAEHLRTHADATAAPNCQALPAGHKRRIFFGVPVDGEFGLGYEEVDANGNPVAGTFKDVAAFDHMAVDVCLPLAAQNQPVTETWELVNVSGEDHNFHIHQTKFREVNGSGDTSVLMDSLAIPHGTNACDGTVAPWRSGACQVKPVTVAIPFSQLGDFVYHCHILEHEDGGMMAHIRVVAQP